MGIPELTIRFLDSMKIVKRQQLLQAEGFVQSIGSFFAANGDKTFFEITEEGLARTNAILGENEHDVDKKENSAPRVMSKEEIEYQKSVREKIVAMRINGTVNETKL